MKEMKAREARRVASTTVIGQNMIGTATVRLRGESVTDFVHSKMVFPFRKLG